MESLNMKTLANSLPNSANTHKQLTDNFKAAALSITTFYRSSLAASKEAYSSGYLTCLQDTLQFIEAGVSVSGSPGEEMTIGRVMDWLEARLEAIKSTQEEEEEDGIKENVMRSSQEEPSKEERDKRLRKAPSTAISQSRLQRRSKDNLQEPLQPVDSVVTPPCSTSLSSSLPVQRPTKVKKGLKEFGVNVLPNETESTLPLAITSATDFSPFTFPPDVVLPFSAAGTKRRHAAMISDSPGSSSITSASSMSTPLTTHTSGRRRRARGGPSIQNVNAPAGASQVSAGESMDVEDDGRERKRVARR